MNELLNDDTVCIFIFCVNSKIGVVLSLCLGHFLKIETEGLMGFVQLGNVSLFF